MHGSYPSDIVDEEIFGKLAQVFTNHVGYFQDYINYSSNLPSIAGRLMTFKLDHEEFDNVLKSWEKSIDVTIKELLQQPKQRLTAYLSFLSFLLDQTPEDHQEISYCVSTWGNGNPNSNMVTWPSNSVIRQISCGGKLLFYKLYKKEIMHLCL